MKVLTIIFISVLLAACSSKLEPVQIVDLWDTDAPTSSNLSKAERPGKYWTDYVSIPQLLIYKAASKGDGKAVVICPGGGYFGLNMAYEGTEWGRWFQQKGITAIVLKYRAPNHLASVPFEDVEQTFRYLRKNADELNLDPNKTGVIGFSAGGHLAAYASTHSALNVDTRPAFCVLYYSVITMEDGFTEVGSRYNLLGEHPSKDEIEKYSLEKQVNKNTPPTLIFANTDDPLVPVENSIMYADSLKNKGVLVDLNIYPTGGHGWGSSSDFEYTKDMTAKLETWIKSLDLK